MNEDYVPSVFTVLREIESMESTPGTQTPAPVEKQQRQELSATPLKHIQQNKKPHHNMQINKYKNPNQPERKNLADEVNKIHMMNQLKQNETEKREAETKSENTQVQPQVRPKQNMNYPRQQVRKPMAKQPQPKLPEIAVTAPAEAVKEKPAEIVSAVKEPVQAAQVKRRGRKPKAAPSKTE